MRSKLKKSGRVKFVSILQIILGQIQVGSNWIHIVKRVDRIIQSNSRTKDPTVLIVSNTSTITHNAYTDQLNPFVTTADQKNHDIRYNRRPADRKTEKCCRRSFILGRTVLICQFLLVLLLYLPHLMAFTVQNGTLTLLIVDL